MRKITRIKNLVIGTIMIAFIVVLLAIPEIGPALIVVIIGAALIVNGIRTLIFYITMARHMVGGKKTLFHSILMLDLGVFMMTGFQVSEQLVLIYLTGILAVSAGIDIIRALESKKEGAPWIRRLSKGVICIAILVIANIFKNNPNVMVYIFCIELLYLAIGRIASVFRRTAVIYIPE